MLKKILLYLYKYVYRFTFMKSNKIKYVLLELSSKSIFPQVKNDTMIHNDIFNLVPFSTIKFYDI